MRIAPFLLSIPIILIGLAPTPALSETRTQDQEHAQFLICKGSNRVTCIVDGDTIWYRGTKIRIADIDTPEISRPSCAREAEIGRRATERMRELLNSGAFSLAQSADGRNADRFGRKLRVVMRGGVSLGETLVSEGLAERWGGPKVAWC